MASITPQSSDYSRWYNDVVLQADLADHAPVRGCMIIKPYGYAIWEAMQRVLDDSIKKTGHQNLYFPLLIPEDYLKREAEHVEGFAPELAVVTHGGGKKLEEPLVIRPTSETIIWATYAKWIQSYRDLPLLYNQWANVVRWEMRPRLFLRTTEFLWQEGHTAHATESEAREETTRMLEVYRSFSEEWMALPMITGRKTNSERFAGAVDTLCIEAMMGDTKALQAGTSHFLGQNFAKAFDVTYQDEDGQRKHVWATSWGVSTRLIGALVMGHGDDRGLNLPPKLAPYQVVIVPIYRENNRAEVLSHIDRLKKSIDEKIRVHVDDRDQYKPGYKFHDWEMRGVPLRIEVGPKDMEKNQVVMSRRDVEGKDFLSDDNLTSEITQRLDAIQKGMFDRALKFREDNTVEIDSWSDFTDRFEGDGGGGFVWAHWDGSEETEAEIKNQTKATIRLLPLEDADDGEEGKCVRSGRPSKQRVLFAKSY